MRVALLAALSLGLANVFSVFMVQAEARGRAFIAGVTEMFYWLANIIATRYAVTSFHLNLVVACVVSAFLSTFWATKHGHKTIDDKTDERQDSALALLEERLEVLEGEE